MSYSHRDEQMCPIFLCGLLEFSQFFDGICLPSSRLLTTCVCPISRMCPNFQIGHICIKRSSNRTHVDVSCSSSEYLYEICTHVVNTLDPASATSRLQSLRAILLSLATPPHPTPNPTQPIQSRVSTSDVDDLLPLADCPGRSTR